MPSSFFGSLRVFKTYQDAMALVGKYEKPDMFITVTCNLSWTEIQNELLPSQTAQDRPDLVIKISRSKYEELKKDVYDKGVLSKVIAHVHVVEFQKRGLPHVHMFIIVDENEKLNSLEDYDCVVRAKIPNEQEELELYNTVVRHMIPGPCGSLNPSSPMYEAW